MHSLTLHCYKHEFTSLACNLNYGVYRYAYSLQITAIIIYGNSYVTRIKQWVLYNEMIGVVNRGDPGYFYWWDPKNIVNNYVYGVRACFFPTIFTQNIIK